MDYIILSALSCGNGFRANQLMITYDIVCQWSKKVFARVHQLPSDLQVQFGETEVTFGVPKFHLPAHGKSCQHRYSLNYIPGSARTDGEGVEREWSHINLAAMSTREMSPGQRHEVLDDMWNGWNWRKLTSLGMRLPFSPIRVIVILLIYDLFI
jgi:hypothetical protein